MLQCPIRPEDARAIPTNGWYAGVDAVEKGVAFCHDLNYGTATDADQSRINRVARPLSTEAAYLRQTAGVSARAFPAAAQGQKLELLAPGSVCEIAVLAAPTLGDLVTACAMNATYLQGKFLPGKIAGRGSATVLRTIAANTSPTNYSDCFFGGSVDGSATYTSSTKTVTKTGAFAGVPATANLQGNEYVYVLAGTTTNAGGAASTQATAGRYKIVTKTSDDAVIVETAIAAADVDLAFYAVRGTPTVLAQLHGSPDLNLEDESGLLEWVTPITDGSGASTGAALMTGGLSMVFGGFDLDNGNCTHALANGTFHGQKKLFYLAAAITTSDAAIAATSSNIVALMETLPVTQTDPDDFAPTALASLAIDAADDFVSLVWQGSVWIVTGASVGVVAA